MTSSPAPVLENGWVKPSRRIFDNAKVSDHFAIIPTASEAKHLDDAETKIYDMVARRFVAVTGFTIAAGQAGADRRQGCDGSVHHGGRQRQDVVGRDVAGNDRLRRAER